jgi:SAM-dependent methyltransferase
MTVTPLSPTHAAAQNRVADKVTYHQSVNQHYGQPDLKAKILTALQNAGKNIDALTRDDLKTFDEFHFGGIAETRNLAELADLKSEIQLLDVGSGLGGPARTLAAEFGCHVTGLDLTEAFCQVAEMLTERVGLADRITFQQGNALDMPFEDSRFDVVWTQFTGMNIEDKPRLYSQIRRVLKNGGILAIHEVMAGSVSNLYYPVFWANDSSLNYLKSPQEIRHLLTERGFEEIAWKDLTQHSAEWFRALIERAKQSEPSPLGLNVFIADSVPHKVANVLRNLEENRVVVIQAVFKLSK